MHDDDRNDEAADLDDLQAELAAQLGPEAAELLTTGQASPCGGCGEGPSVLDSLVALTEEAGDDPYDLALSAVVSHIVGTLDELREQQATLVRLAEVVIPLGEQLSQLGERVERDGIAGLLGDGGIAGLLGR